ncbi:NAD(P)-binding protein [Pleurostoma richardsiae]|uniref:NAD(P)-binding protein n=1 Tax=Pleurostoma richardsiae TaxID=41990 RepID=A0AA38RDD3_9PEZI|nr:NAD(P)-binding protein [Pleurostoma richardsiae]
MPSYAIAGASRGIGYALLKELSADPANVVIGIVRSTGPLEEKIANELPGRKNIHVVYGDLVNLSSLKSAADSVSAITGGSLDVLIANAAIVKPDFYSIDDPKQKWEDFDKDCLDSFNTNALGTIHLMALFVPLIRKGQLKKIVAISSGMADIDFILESGVRFQSPYAISKAALNLAIAKFHVEHAKEGILFMALSPGFVDTGHANLNLIPGGGAGMQELMDAMTRYAPHVVRPATPEESATAVLNVIDKATIEKNGGIMVSHLGTKRWL